MLGLLGLLAKGYQAASSSRAPTTYRFAGMAQTVSQNRKHIDRQTGLPVFLAHRACAGLSVKPLGAMSLDAATPTAGSSGNPKSAI
jgi:hypothetical protein